jgi:hypothetical protein
VADTTVAALEGHANPWRKYGCWGESRSKSEFDGQATITTLNTLRVLVEHGGSSIDFGWSLPSTHDPDSFGILDRLIPGYFPDYNSLSAPEDFLWLTAPERVNLLGQELELFYISMFITLCIHWRFDASSASAASNVHRLSALFQKVTDPSMLAHTRYKFGIGVLHSLVAWLPYLEDGQQAIILQLLNQLVHIGALEIADSMQHYTPLTWATAVSASRYLFKYRHPDPWQPEHASEILASGLNLWLEMLGSAGVDIRWYFSRQCELGATEPIECCVIPYYIKKFPEHFLDQRWYVKLTFWENPDATERNNPRDFGIGVEYYPVQRKFRVPGAWSDEPEQTDQSDQDDVQSRVEELGIEDGDDQDDDDQDDDDQDDDDQDDDDQDDDDQDDDDQDDDDQDDDDQDDEGSDGDAEDGDCDEAADPD